MCGICGQFNFTKPQAVKRTDILAMANTMTHRGPDDEGCYISGTIGLGFRRLSIIDLVSGHQPMSDQEKTVWVVFNGEIYNFKELRNELESYGYEFMTKSDTEVIVHGYKKWGVEVLHHLNGMFGLAVWDECNKRLMLARDRMGIKLIYYRIANGSLFFGSEIRALLSSNRNPPSLDPVGLNLFLRYRYTPSPLTIFRNINKLAPGSRLIVEKGSYKVERWWNYKPVPIDSKLRVDKIMQDLLDIYKRAVKRHLISDVPLGLLLSGGVDSALLLALMKQFGDNWKTFTVGYGKSYEDDELIDAERTANVLNQPNYPVLISEEIFNATLTKIIKQLEEPIASSSIVPMYHVSERARADVKVALIGQGPDELFGGYNRHVGLRYGHYWRAFPDLIRKPVKYVMNRLIKRESIKRSLYSLDTPDRITRYQQVFSLMPGKFIDNLFNEDLLPSHVDDVILQCWHDLIPLMDHTDELGGFQFLEIRSSLPDELLMYADKLSMAHGLELRIPYLDQEIVEYVERLPAKFKIHNGIRKWIHKEICKEFLPNEIVKRKKRGFAVNVVDSWFRASMGGKFKQTFYDDCSSIYNYLKKHEIRKLFDDHNKGYADNHKILFSLVVFEEWLKIYGVRN